MNLQAEIKNRIDRDLKNSIKYSVASILNPIGNTYKVNAHPFKSTIKNISESDESIRKDTANIINDFSRSWVRFLTENNNKVLN